MDLLRERAIIVNFLTHDYKHVSFFMALIQRNILWNARLDEVIHWQIALLVLLLGFSLHAFQITRSIGQIVQVLVELRLIELTRRLLVSHWEGKTFISERPIFFEMLSARQNSEVYFIQFPCVCNSDKRYLKLGDEVRHQVFQVSLFILDWNSDLRVLAQVSDIPDAKRLHSLTQQIQLFFLHRVGELFVFKRWMVKLTRILAFIEFTDTFHL